LASARSLPNKKRAAVSGTLSGEISQTASQIAQYRLIAAAARQFRVAVIQGYLIGNMVDVEIGIDVGSKIVDQRAVDSHIRPILQPPLA
jgi:hypothetical protein